MNFKGFNLVDTVWDVKDRHDLVTGSDTAIPRIHSAAPANKEFFGNGKSRKGLPSFSLNQLASLPELYDRDKCGYILTSLWNAYKPFRGAYMRMNEGKITADIIKNGIRLKEDVAQLLPSLTKFDEEFIREWLPAIFPAPVVEYLKAGMLADKILNGYNASSNSQR